METQVTGCLRGGNDSFVNFKDSCENVVFVRDVLLLWAKNFIKQVVHHEPNGNIHFSHYLECY